MVETLGRSSAMTAIATFDDTASGWGRSLYAFLAEKDRRSGSRRTVECYGRMLSHFFGRVGNPPDKVTGHEVICSAYNPRPFGQKPVVSLDRRPNRLP